MRGACMEIVLLIATLAVRRQSGFETSAALLLFMCCLIPVLMMRGQPDTDTITMHSSSGATCCTEWSMFLGNFWTMQTRT